ncbi:polyribonucleotide nucleotidyltransferase [Candidatus Berkelbacteria bacterium]|nr:polyribonucleotide nucleotidyltransferase [Candidatus Berkelbacteria bacterium]
MEKKVYTAEFGGTPVTLTLGGVAEQADGAVMVQYGETVVLVTAVVSDSVREGIDFFPLMVEYEERLYAAGKISGSRFIKREGRPSENAILNGRLIDRPIRPLFPKGYRNDVQVIATILSMDGEHDPDMPAMLGASVALMVSKAPFEGPIVGMRVGLGADDQFIFNPTLSEQATSKLDVVVAAKRERIMMLEAGANQVPEATMVKAIEAAHAAMAPLFDLQEQIAKELGEEKPTVVPVVSELVSDLKEHLGEKLAAAVREADKAKRTSLIEQYETDVLSAFEGNYKQVDIKSMFGQLVEKEVRQVILRDGLRPDGRSFDEIRPLSAEVGLLPRTHGSAIFSRGQTQVLSIVTLGGPGEEQMIDTMEEEGEKRFMHHYNFPPFSVGEVKPMRSVGRREIGHGALAERALAAIIPDKEAFPYTIRVVSETLSSNGSSSMASTCAAMLALMDAGVPVKAIVGGMAVGLMTEEGFNEDAAKGYKLLTDIQGIEDFGGDMDFKVTGTTEGITAIQLDMKVKGLPIAVIAETLEQAKAARTKALEFMKGILAEPRAELSKYAPRILTVKIPVDKIGELIGPGGKNINGIIERAGGKALVDINIAEDGTVSITALDAAAGEQAKAMVEGQMKQAEVGELYDGVVTNIQKNRMTGQEIGAIVEFLPGKDGMVHISEISEQRIPTVSSVLKVGDKVKVKVKEVDRERGRVSLSIKAAKQTPSQSPQQ